ncbi:hypothetical protein An09g01400 [Aspergillus niger]|uniref:Uncharacterized protein n=2 Tax=Aspergillus niger TaxID=5061 RepID=A2QTA5_ASPNC|nr:hypothetical protein An09g01400 [Aspergillus niger]CAK49061.1 hypothetical protein An09g01400 [Aspergillus niger]
MIGVYKLIGVHLSQDGQRFNGILTGGIEWIDTEDAEGRVAVKTSHGRVLSEYIVFRDNYGITETAQGLRSLGEDRGSLAPLLGSRADRLQDSGGNCGIRAKRGKRGPMPFSVSMDRRPESASYSAKEQPTDFYTGCSITRQNLCEAALPRTGLVGNMPSTQQLFELPAFK